MTKPPSRTYSLTRTPRRPVADGMAPAVADSKDFGHLGLVAEMMQEFTGSGNFERMVHHGLERVSRHLGAEASSLFLTEPRRGASLPDATPDMVCYACFGPADHTGVRLPWGVGLVGRCIAEGRMQALDYGRNDSPPTDEQIRLLVGGDLGITLRSLLIAPLILNGEALGALTLVNKGNGEAFSAEDQRLLVALSSAAALGIMNIRLARKLAAQERLRHELELAADIQRGLLPPAQPSAFPLHGLNVPLSQVSGDFYDVVALPDGRLWGAIADVSGKGLNAALLMAKTSSLFRCLAKDRPTPTPGALLERISEELCETASHGMFVTMACLLYDPKDGSVVLANAGHEPPMVHDPKRGEFHLITTGGPPLGILPGLFCPSNPAEPVEARCILPPGGSLILLTDGLTEAANSRGTMLGGDGLRPLLAATAPLAGQARLEALLDLIGEGGWNRRDDMTVLTLTPPESSPENAPKDVDQQPQSWRLDLPAVPASLAILRRFIAACASHLCAPDGWRDDLVLAVDEAAQNIIRHGYGGGDLHRPLTAGVEVVVPSPDRPGSGVITVRLYDDAPTVFPGSLHPRPLEELSPDRLEDLHPGGLGLALINALTDEWVLEPIPPDSSGKLRARGGIPCGNCLRLVKHVSIA